jgi:hypothetical protein
MADAQRCIDGRPGRARVRRRRAGWRSLPSDAAMDKAVEPFDAEEHSVPRPGPRSASTTKQRTASAPVISSAGSAGSFGFCAALRLEAQALPASGRLSTFTAESVSSSVDRTTQTSPKPPWPLAQQR